ncbi:MAG: PQQ-binding-like beta-propeller repeat protein [Deltaproteobacteria bacterium]|jgi:hypothetical protein|nr:PQQ-binding-like beta-propeller repeat protein [Deltaproteobacteria bacterium]MBT6435879.1 PQQ-binding-like beta-propeller repeat protein [Deltaproteobacteria bacterium]MBT6490924.1 PQQ-binding-like beta-propeller repeat protein [Deltaproteobacteria bacterium]
MKYFIHLGLLLVLVGTGATVWADAEAILLAPRTFSEYFTDDLLEDTTEAGNGEPCSELGCARSYGWGKGYVTHARVGFAVREGNYTRMPQARPPAPAPLPPSIKPTQVVAGHFRTNSNGGTPQVPQDVIALTASSGGCHLHYMMNKGPDDSGENHLGWNVGVLVPSNTWTTGHFVSGQANGADNWWLDVDGQTGGGDGINDPGADCQADENNDLSADNQYGTALFAGDFDSDGWTDVLYLRAADRNRAGFLDLAYMFWNTGVLNAQGVPVFQRAKLASNTPLYEKGVAWHFSSDIGEVVDMDNDGRSDLVLASSSGSSHRIIVFRQQGSPNRSDPFRNGEVVIVDQAIGPAADSNNPARTNFGCLANDGPTRGITALTVADFSGDGQKDIIIGSMSEQYMFYYFKTGPANTAYESTTILNPRGGVTGLHKGNWNLEGGEDILLTRSGKGCYGDLYPEANLWLLENQEADLERARFNFDYDAPLASMSNHIHYATPLDLDHDEDGYLDFMMGTNQTWGSYYYYVHNIWKGLYNADAVIMSKRMDNLNSREEAIVRATFSGVIAEDYDDTTMDVEFYLSNNGQDWDLLPLDELPPSVGGTGPNPHIFTTFGTDLRWAIVSKAQAVATVGDAENAALNQTDKVAKVVPKFSGIQIAVNGIGAEYYSRSGLSQKLGTDERIIYSASFRYPGNEGFLRAYDLTDVGVGQAQSGVNPGPNPHLSLMWEAGALLKDRASTSRRILTYEVNDSGDVGSLVELSEGTPDLANMLGFTENDDAVSLFQFVRDGLDHPDGWKFYDVGHSSPVYVGAPTGPAEYGAYSVNNYEAFQEAEVSRNGVVYIGSNGGGLHAFDADTGHEKWMFIPNNLLSKLKDLRDDSNNYRADYIMDGPIVIQDVYQESLGKWRTVLLAGQAKGVGGDGFNYYFALDITDPGTDPIPLWEYSDTTDNEGDVCSGNPQYETEECQPGACDDGCSQDGRVYAQQDSETYGEMVVLDAAYADVLVDMTAISGNNSRLTVDAGSQSCPTPSSSQSLQGVYASGCPLAQYKFNLEAAKDKFFVFMRVRNTEDTGANLLWYSINNDESYARVDETIKVTAGSGTDWKWVKSLVQPVLGSGNHDLTIWSLSDKLEVEQIVITTKDLNIGSLEAANLSSECLEICQPQVCQTVTKVVADPTNMEWPECGVGKELKCCSYASNSSTYLEGGSFCRPVAEDCASSVPDAAMGETWSEPAIGRVLLNNKAEWVVFFASGYSNLKNSNVGRTVYALDAYTGEKLKDWTLKEEAPALGEGSAEIPTINIENALTASPMLVDLSTEDKPGYGYVDRLYIGDLEGRVWKIVMDVNSRGNIDQWKRCVFFDAGDYDGDGLRNWAPIITRPQVAMIETGQPNVFFGTGGDDRAPNDVRYRFYAVQDEEPPGVCAAETDLSKAKNATDMRFGNTGNFEWVMGDGFKNSEWPLQPVTNASEEGDSGDRYWSDPLIVDNELIYFASLAGKIESVDPTVNIAGGDSKIYCVAIRNSSELNLKAGESCWTSGSVFERESVKIRKAMMVQGIAQEAWARDALPQGTDEANIFYQRFSESETPPPTLVHQGTGRAGLIKILRWREVPL